MNKGTKRIIIGVVLIVLQLLSIIGNAKAGVNFQLSFASVSVFLYDLVILLTSNLVGVAGLVCLISGVVARCRDRYPKASPLPEEETPAHASPAAERPVIWKSALLSLLLVAAYYICVVVIGTVVSLIVSFLYMLPVLDKLIDLLFSVRGDSPGMLVVTLSAIAAYFISGALIEKIEKHKSTLGLSYFIAGILILLLQSVNLLLCILSKGFIYPNIVHIIAGIVILNMGRRISSDAKERQ